MELRYDKDVPITHPDADWMTQPHVCGDRGMNDEMWLYEWRDGDLQSELAGTSSTKRSEAGNTTTTSPR